MPSSIFSPVLLKNRLLSSLAREEYLRLLPALEPVEMASGKVLYEMHDTIRHAYFPLNGMISLLALTEAGDTIEVGMVGNEGVVGIPAVLRINRTPYRVMVQIPGRAMRIRSDSLRDAFNRGGRLQDLLLRYTYMLLTQISQSAVCNHYHTVEQRLSRWLLVTRDRVHSNEFQLTQEMISHMLGIPRTNVTMRASDLRQKGYIRYSRGRISISNPPGLEAAACECYRMVREEISSFLVA